ncbi:MAG: LAGLIDADG family homing endonuclease [Candidatus Diapherotrites archaeon]
MKLFLRGLFDTDGFIHKDYKYISFKSADNIFINEVRKEIIKLGLQPSETIVDNSGVAELRIYSKDVKKFSNEIGFSHPRKKKILKNHVEKGTKIKVFSGFRDHVFSKNYLDLTLIKGLRIKGLGKRLREMRMEKNLTQKEFAKELKIFRRNYSRFERDQLAAPIEIYVKLMEKQKLLEELSANNVKFGTKGFTFVKLKLKLSQRDKKLFEYLLPNKHSVAIVQRHPKYLRKFEGIDNLVKKEFGVEIHNCSGQKIIQSSTLATYLKTFCKYQNQWTI